MKRTIVISFIFMSVLLHFGQNSFEVGGMHMRYELQGDSISIELQAPTQGWLAIGFNSRDDIVGADLKQFRIRDGKVEAEDQFVVGFQQHPADSAQNIRIIKGVESAQYSLVKFKIPLNAVDPQDFQHQPEQPFWVILAYSVSDDFDHHSRMRKHIPLQWNS